MISDSGENKKRLVLVVQCRLSSTRLPRKALLDLHGKALIEWNLCAMKKVPADDYYLATDEDSFPELKPHAEKCGFKIFAGSREDVLDRFCKVIELSSADVVVRATADNPFLFYEAACEMISVWNERAASEKIDYLTFSGLPHGSGVEMFDAHSLLDAAKKTDSPYDHEHAGPALYNHGERYNSVFMPAPEKYRFPDLRTTVDTYPDYIRAQKIAGFLFEKGLEPPFSYDGILSAFEKPAIKNPVILIPSVEKGHGTGHLHRCLDLALENGWDVYIPENATLEQCGALVEKAFGHGLKEYQIVKSLDWIELYSLAVLDSFCTPENLIKKISQKCTVCALDEGSQKTDCIEYLLDIIPSAGIERRANLSEPAFIPLPKKRKAESSVEAKIHAAIVVLGGEDPGSLSVPAAKAIAMNSVYVTVVASSEKSVPEMEAFFDDDVRQYIKVVPPVENLKEKLSDYDLVVTHYGFTAFEASAAGCAVILLGTTVLHEKLSEKYGFVCISPENINAGVFKEKMDDPPSLHRNFENSTGKSLGEYIALLSRGLPLSCPVCRSGHDSSSPLVARIPERTFRRCKKCGMLYQSWTVQSVQTEYNRGYFYEDYEKQYGKTYEDDFYSIKSQGVRRIGNIERVFHCGHHTSTGSVLDIGCALGPFLDAAGDAGWQVYGTDISRDAVEYVRTKLKYPAVCASFPDSDIAAEFGVESFDAVTMWYVIEHFQDLDSVLKAVSKLVKKGGVFAFSTPSASGVSGRYSTQSFFEQSPSDHYSLWEPKRAASILKKYGFKVCRIVPTGIHPERFPSAKKHGWKRGDFQFKVLEKMSLARKLGDTFECYCRKVR